MKKGRYISRQELAKLAMETQRIVETIQGMPLGRQVKGFTFGLKESSEEKGSFESVTIQIQGRPTSQHLAVFDRLHALFPDEELPESTAGERFGIRYRVRLRSKSAQIEVRWVGLRLIDQVQPHFFLYRDRTFSPDYDPNRPLVAVVLAKDRDRLWLISTNTPSKRLAWGEGVIQGEFTRLDSFLPFQPDIQLDDFDTLWQEWRERAKTTDIASHPAIHAVVSLSDGLIPKGRWCLPTAQEAAFIYQPDVRLPLQPLLAKAGISLSKDVWLREEASERHAYKLHFQSLHSSVVPAVKGALNRVIAVTTLRWDEIETWQPDSRNKNTINKI